MGIISLSAANRTYDRLNISGDHMEVWYVPSATHVPCIRRSENKTRSTRMYLSSECVEVLLVTCHSHQQKPPAQPVIQLSPEPHHNRLPTRRNFLLAGVL